MTTFDANIATPAASVVSTQNVIQKVWAAVREIRARQNQKAVLSRLNERDLRDIGMIESDIQSMQTMPLGSDAALALDRRRFERSGNW